MTDNQKVDILLLEDSAYDAELIMRAISKSGSSLAVRNLKDGAEGLEYLRTLQETRDEQPLRLPRLILLDLKMPKINGLEVLQALKSSPLTGYIPVVVFSSSQEHQDIIKCYELGANSYVTKPVDYESFINAINNMLQYWLSFNLSPFNRGM